LQPSHLEVIPIGGLGEFGMNMMLYRYGSDCIVVDSGIMFPGEEHLGVDVVIPDLSYLDDCGDLHAAILTHAHEDHIGALPHLLSRQDVPVIASGYSRGLTRGRLEHHEARDRCRFESLPGNGNSLEVGPFRIETIPAAHSIPQSNMLVLHTPVGTVLHTADFKLDPNPPDGAGTDLGRLSELGRRGVLLLLSDSTNAEVPGFTPSERVVSEALDGQIAGASQRVFVTCFSSNIQRIQQIAALAGRHDRKIALVGTSIRNQVDVAERLGLIRFPPGLRVAAEDAMVLPRERLVVVATGSQGEPMSALARIAVDKHRDVAIEPGDMVIHSARVIPGNEKSINRMINHLLRRGAEVVTSAEAAVHVSGHASQDELRQLLQLVRPRYLLPIHGEYRQLLAHARLGSEAGLDSSKIRLAESGDVVAVNENVISIEERIHVGRVFIDAALDEVDRSILRDRRRSAGDGIVVAVIAVDREGGAVNGFPEIVTRGFVPDGDSGDAVMDDAKRLVVSALAEATPEERADEAMLRARIHTVLKRFFRRRTQRQPLIIPVIVEQ
jgi:ribonuclease J